MITLIDQNQDLKFYLAGAVATTSVKSYVSYRAIGNGGNDVYNYGSAVSSGVGAVLCPAPTDAQREHLIHNITIHNEDSAAVEVTVRVEDIVIDVYKVTLQTGERVIYTEEGEWQTYNALGVLINGAGATGAPGVDGITPELPLHEIAFGDGVGNPIISDPSLKYDPTLGIFEVWQPLLADYNILIDNNAEIAIFQMNNPSFTQSGFLSIDSSGASTESRWAVATTGVSGGSVQVTIDADGSGPSLSTMIIRIDGYDIIELSDNAAKFQPKNASTFELRCYEQPANGTDYIGFKAPSARTSNTSIIIVLPVDDPTAGQVMQFSAPSGGVVTASWVTPAGAYTDEMAQDAIGAMISGEFTYADATPLLSINTIAESKITFTDITTGNSASTQHGYLKKLSANTYDSLDGTGNWVRRYNGLIACSMGNGNTVNASTTTYMQPYLGSSGSTTESNRQITMPIAGLAKGFQVRTKNTQTATGSLVITARQNAANTSCVVTIAAGSVAGIYSDTVNSFTFAVGDKISFQVKNNGTIASTEIMDITLGLWD